MDAGPIVMVSVVGYLLGSIPVAVLVGRARGFDPRDVGDRNPGYWNMKEQLGRWGSVPVFLGDAAKGAAAGAVGLALDGSGWGIGWIAVGAAMIGHAFPVFAGFRGGRSILTFAGGVSVLAPPAAVFSLVACVGVSLVTGRFAFGARVGIFAFPAFQALFDERAKVAATGALMTIIGVRFAMAAVADRQRSDAATSE